MHLFENNFQNWRVVAIDLNNQPRLLCLGGSYGEARDSYPTAFFKLLREEERRNTRHIYIQRWSGVADRGHWITKGNLPILSAPKLPSPAKAG